MKFAAFEDKAENKKIDSQGGRRRLDGHLASEKGVEVAEPSEAIVEGWVEECEASGKAAFLENGGSEEDFKREQKQGSRDALGKAFEKCIGDSFSLEEIEADLVTDADIARCEKSALRDFEKAGGSRDEF